MRRWSARRATRGVEDTAPVQIGCVPALPVVEIGTGYARGARPAIAAVLRCAINRRRVASARARDRRASCGGSTQKPPNKTHHLRRASTLHVRWPEPGASCPEHLPARMMAALVALACDPTRDATLLDRSKPVARGRNLGDLAQLTLSCFWLWQRACSGTRPGGCLRLWKCWWE